MMIIIFSFNDGSMDVIVLGNYVNNYIIDEIWRVKGVGEVEVFGI